MEKVKILFIINIPDFFYLRLPIALEAKKRGFNVQVATGHTPKYKEIENLGFTYHPLPITRSGKNPPKKFGIYMLFINYSKK